MDAKALRNYETLSTHTQPHIPAGATLVGILAKAKGIEPNRRRWMQYILETLSNIANRFITDRLMPRKAMAIIDVFAHQSFASLLWEVTKTIFNNDGADGVPPSDLLKALEITTGNLGFRELDQRGRKDRAKQQTFSQRMLMAMFWRCSTYWTYADHDTSCFEKYQSHYCICGNVPVRACFGIGFKR